MGLGASVASKNKNLTQSQTTDNKSMDDVPVILELKNDVAMLEKAVHDDKALDAFIEGTQTLSTRASPIADDKNVVVTDYVQTTSRRLEKYLDNIEENVEKVKETLEAFQKAVMARCQQYSENEKHNKQGRVRLQLRVVDDLLNGAKSRLQAVKGDNSSSNQINACKRQVQELQLFRSDLQAGKVKDGASGKGDRKDHLGGLLQGESGKEVLEDILRWRDETLRLRGKYDSLLDNNEKLVHESEEHISTLQITNKKLIRELSDLRGETVTVDAKAEKANERVQKIEEKLLEERLSHEVEINALKAMLEKRDAMLATLVSGKASKPGSPEPEKGAVRLTPEGFLDETETKANTDLPVKQEEEIIEDDNVEKLKPTEETPNEIGEVDSFREWIKAFDGPKDEAVAVSEQSQTQEEKEDAHIKSTLDKLQAEMIDTNEGDVDSECEDDDKKATPDENNQEDSYIAGVPQQKDVDVKMKPQKVNEKTHANTSRTNEEQPVKLSLGTNEQPDDVVVVEEGTTKEIIFRRNDGDIDGSFAYHRGVGAVIRTSCSTFGVDSVTCEVTDAVGTDMLPDLMDGERPVSFHINFQQKFESHFKLKADDTLAVYVPHRPVGAGEEVCLVQRVDGGDWEPSDPAVDAPASLDPSIPFVGTVLHEITDIKLVVIAREKADHVIAGEDDVRHVCTGDPSVTLNISKAAFKSRTEVKVMVHHRHIQALPSAIQLHEECARIVTCTAYVALVCEHLTCEDMYLAMELPEETGKPDVAGETECKFTMLSLEDGGWRLADCTWRREDRLLHVHLPAGARKYRLLGLELPTSLTVEERLAAARALHEHTEHYLARLLFRQRQDAPDQAVLICLRAPHVRKGIHQLAEAGYNVGGFPSTQVCMADGDTLSLEFSGDISAQPVNADNLSLTFHSQKEIASRQLRLVPTKQPLGGDGPTAANMVQGCLNVLRNGDRETILHGETVYYPRSGVFDSAFLEENDALAKRAAAETATSPRRTDGQKEQGVLKQDQ
ncbi:hypothetical protein MAR_038375 [Mya arenaria]|uniref:Uncharacterized protein n=1 Tax=Mya arenaria TaxID=6604 RepID=A0ABY7FV33_MYAAR|nr:uncharacterized protein LOC128213617 [Mya arenaria]WAR24706.1 hypothetical protein MAR_038375 [Mya arenaria]